MWIFWLVIILLAIVAELATINMVSIWFALGGAVALLADLLSVKQTVQILLFFVVSLIGILIFLFVFRPKMQKAQGKLESTNADRIIGREAVVIKDIQPYENLGQIKVLGQIWSAVSVDEEGSIPVNTKVKVVGIKGVRAVVCLLDD